MISESVPGQPGFKLPYSPYNEKGKTLFSLKLSLSVFNEERQTNGISPDEIASLLLSGEATITKNMNDISISRISDGVVVAKVESIHVE